MKPKAFDPVSKSILKGINGCTDIFDLSEPQLCLWFELNDALERLNMRSEPILWRWRHTLLYVDMSPMGLVFACFVAVLNSSYITRMGISLNHFSLPERCCRRFEDPFLVEYQDSSQEERLWVFT